MKCANCGREDTIRTAIRDGKLIKNLCDKCLASYKGYADFAKQHDRNAQRRTYAKDILQKWDGDKLDPKYVDAYGEQFSDDIKRDYGINRKQF